LPVGEPFSSDCAPKPASAVEARLRQGLTDRIESTPGFNAIRVRRPFFDHLEVWPDILLPELRIAVEYDSTGRHGLEHVGRRTDIDRRKDRAVRAAGWEVVRIRTGKLEKLGPHDLQLSGLNGGSFDAILDEFRSIRGPLFVDAYLR
jgi:very-short-patch-repair endonuclease